MRGAIVAEDEGNLDDYVDAVNRAMWEEGLKMDDLEVIATFLSANGFDGPALLTRTQEPAIKAKLAANTEAAVARGVFGIPTFFVGRSEEHTSELQSLMRISYAVFCLTKNT